MADREQNPARRLLEALESDQVKPTEAKAMREYHYQSLVDGGDRSRYENMPAMHDLETCTVWVLHMHLHPSALPPVLERMSVLSETTGEYTYGDSWTEWGEETDDDADRHLAIYFAATPARAQRTGDWLATSATFAAMRALGGDNAEIPPHAISTSGDYAEQLRSN